MLTTARAVRLASRPEHSIAAEHFEIFEEPLPELGDQQVLVRNTWMSVDPYMRLPLTGRRGASPAKKVGDLMDGAAVGVVEASRAAALPVGSVVLSQKGWRDRFVAAASELRPAPGGAQSESWYVGVLGLTGMTAYPGIEYVLKPEQGETIFISGAAGAVGSLACQLAKRRGARVLASAGSAAKIDWLTSELGVDSAVNYRTTDIGAFLAQHCPQGLDCYFDNVGGPTLDAALRSMKPGGRVGLCGAISQYNDENYRAGPSEFFTIIEKSLSVKGFNAGTAGARAGEVMSTLARLLASGELVWRETIVDGLDRAPAAFASLFQGDNVGKMVVRLS